MLVLTRIRKKPNMSSNYENADKTMTINYNAETKTTDVKKIKNLLEENSEGDASNMQSEEEDSRRSILNSQYLSLTFLLNIRILLFSFIVSNYRKVRFDIAIRSPSKPYWNIY